MIHPPLTQYPNNSQSIQEKFGQVTDKKYAIVMDLELTCWEDPTLTRAQAEIIEIGLVLVDLKTLDIIKEFTATVKPKDNPILTDFCTNLTGITQQEVDSSPSLYDVYKNLLKPILPPKKEYCWVTWGRDSIHLEQELNIKSKNPERIEFDPRLLNLKEFTKAQKIHGGLQKVLETLNLEQVLPRHRALPDAQSTYKLMKYFNVTKEDIMISNTFSYKQAVNKFKQDQCYKLSKQLNISIDKAEKILDILNWDFMKAKEVSLVFLNR
jgi:inhibitor of KinA sporulation pathway (predicted exonuclease)